MSSKTNWPTKKIIELCDFERGTEPGSKSYNREGEGVPFIRVGNIAAQIQEQIYTTSRNIKLCDESDILLTLDGSPGIVTRGFKGAHSSGIRKVIVKKPDELLKDFVYFVLQADFVREIIEKYTTGMTIKHASKSLEYIQIPLPFLPEQQKIVYVLDSIQEMIRVQKKIIEKTKELKKTLLNKIFNSKIKNQKSKLQFKIQKWVKLRNYCHKPEYGYTASATHEPVGPKFLRITDIQNDKVIWETVPFCKCDTESEQKYKLQDGDILIARIGASTGKNFLVKNPPKAIFASYLIRIKTKSDLNPEFLNYYFQTDYYWQEINQQKGGRLKAGINVPILQNLTIPLLSFSEQREIVEVLQTIDKKIEIEQKKRALYEELFKTMLNKLMKGEIKVDNLRI